MVADTSGLISLVIPTDSNYALAVRAAKKLEQQTNETIIIVSDVYAELLNTLGKKYSHTKAVTVGKYFLETSPFLLIDNQAEIRQTALSLFQEQPASVSFTDCMVMACADFYKTKNIFGFDAVFSRSGYTVPE